MRQRKCKICQSEKYYEIETDIRKYIDDHGKTYGIVREMIRRYGDVQKYPKPWDTHIKKHFVYEKAVKAIDADEVIELMIEKGANQLLKTDELDPRLLLSAISIKTKREETKAKQDMTRAMITAFVGGAKNIKVIDGEVVVDKIKELEDGKNAH